MFATRSIISETFITVCCLAVFAACAPVRTADIGPQHPVPDIEPAAEQAHNVVQPAAPAAFPLPVNIAEEEEKLSGDVEPEPAQTIDQELEDLKRLGKWEEGVPAVAATDDVVEYDFPVTLNRQVEYYLDFFTGRHRKNFEIWLARSGRYLPLIQAHLREAGLPEDLGYLAMIESGYNERAYSRARAVGIWQFIKSTGRNYGLQIDTYVDERRDPVKSTRAAVAYLGDLYGEFDSWYLAVAAYNAGEGKIRRAIKKYRSSDFWKIAQGSYLKLETKRYVPKLIAAIMIAKEPAKYGFDNIAYEEPLAYETVEVPRWTSLKAVALAAGMDPKELKRYNNELRKEFTPPDKGSYPFKVPAGKKDRVENNLPRVQAVVTTGFKTHVARRGETLDAICRKYGLTKTVILKSNNLRSAGLQPGQRLRIPYQTVSYEMLPAGMVAKGYLATEAANGSFILHRVLPGDTVSGLSRRYSVPVHLIAAWNDIDDISRIRAGQQLVFYVQNSGSSLAAVSSPGPVTATRDAAGPARGSQEAVDGFYQVQQGDTLWKIARQFDLEPAALKKRNNLSSNIIHPGDRLQVTELRQEEEKGFYYQVRRGDSLWSIAQKHDIRPEDIRRWNNLAGNLIHPGSQLLLNVAAVDLEEVPEVFYQVRQGDSLWTIAQKHNTSPEKIRLWNNLKNNVIHPGSRLLVKTASGG